MSFNSNNPRIFLPISLDVWRSPIAALLRAVVEYSPEIEFFSFSGTQTKIDAEMGVSLWKRQNLHLLTPKTAWRHRFDLVHTASLNRRNLAIASYCRIHGYGKTRFLTTVNLEIDSSMRREWACYRYALRLATDFCAVSEVVADNIRRDAPHRLREVIPNGFDPVFFDPSVHCDHDLPRAIRELDSGYPLFISSLESRKNPEFIVKLAKQMPDVKFVGAGWERPDTAAEFLPAIQSCPNLIWLGHIEQTELRALLKRAGVLLFPSEREGLPLTVIEAMGMGLPVLAQPKSSLPELLSDAPNCWMYELSEEAKWLQKISEICVSRRGIVSSYDHELRNFAVDRYSWESVGKRYSQLYSKLLA